MKNLFKKSFTIQSQSLMSGSDKKKLKEKLSKYFKTLTNQDIPSDAFDQVIQNKKDLGVVKINNPQAILYCQLGDPLFFDFSNQFYPTIYSLWKIPNLLPTITIHPPVFNYISSGADLMFKGILNVKEVPSKENTMVSILLKGCPFPVAIGYTLKFTESDRNESKGKAVSIIHYVDDSLWNYGSKQVPFNFDQQNINNDEEESDEEVQEEQINEQVDNLKVEQLSITSTTTTTTNNNNNEESDSEEDDESEDEDEKVDEKEIIDKQDNLITKEEMDEIVLKSFMGAIKGGVIDSELPMVLKTFFTKYMLYYAPADVEHEININKSSYKKVSKLLEAMKKKGLVETTEPKPGNILLSKVCRNHPDYKAFQVGQVVGEVKEQQDQQDKEETYGSASVDVPPIKSITQVHPIPLLLHAYNGEGHKYLAFPPIKSMLQKYVVEHKCEDMTNRANVLLDENLSNVLGKKKIGTSISKNQLIQSFKEALALYLSIERVDGSISYTPFKTIQIHAKKIANKYVLEVSNLEVFSIPHKELAKDGMKVFAASTTLQSLGKNMIVKIQGNDTDRVKEYLEQRYNIPSFCIESIISVLKKKKK